MRNILNKFVCGLRTSFSTFDFVSLFSILSEAHFNAPVSASALVSFPSSSSSQGSYAYDDKETTALPECLQYMKSDVNSERSWTQVASYKYLDAESTEALHRILYIPFRRTGKVRYKGYNLYSMVGGGE